jgi:hypothetical protein
MTIHNDLISKAKAQIGDSREYRHTLGLILMHIPEEMRTAYYETVKQFELETLERMLSEKRRT